jgi:hypothetical protein
MKMSKIFASAREFSESVIREMTRLAQLESARQ